MAGLSQQKPAESQQVRDREYFHKTLQLSGLSYREIADQAGCTPAFIGHLVRGYRSVVSTELATDIAEVLDMPLRYLFTPVPSRGKGRTGARKRTPEDADDTDKVTVAA